MSNNLIQNLGRRVLIGSGAIGTVLREQHGRSLLVEALNLSHPDAVRSLHETYRDAGSQFLITNTFAANPMVLKESGLEADCESINRKGVELAREASRGQCLVWASIGPLALGLRLEDYDDDQLKNIYMNQCSGLREADLIVLETFTALREARAAIAALSEINMPFILQVGSIGRNFSRWDLLESFIQLADQSGAIAVGANCQHPGEIQETAEYLTGRTRLPVTMSPNAGQPFIVRGGVTYEFSPDDFRITVNKLLAIGVAVVGGCCGTRPEHIKRISDLALQPVRHRELVEAKVKPPAVEGQTRKPRSNTVRDLIQNREFLISVEIRASRAQSPHEILSGAATLADAGANMFNVPDNPGAALGRDAMIIAAKLQKELGVPSICHMTVTQSNLLRLHSSLIGCGDIGLQGVLAVTGDSPAMGDLAQTANRVMDLRSSVELLRLIKTMREGKTINGQNIAAEPDLCVGCAVGDARSAQIKWLAKKIEAGAEFAFSQPVFDYNDFESLYQKTSELGIRLFPGILPLISKQNAEFLASGRMPGIKVPAEVIASFDAYKDKEGQKRYGLDFAIELATRIAGSGQGLYVIMPFGKTAYADTAEIISAVCRAVKPSKSFKASFGGKA